MAQPWADRFYHSRAWLRCREAVVKERMGICEECQGLGNEVHHIIELTQENVGDPMIALGKENLMLLCHSCHDATKYGRTRAARSDVGFDVNGDVIPRTEPQSSGNFDHCTPPYLMT